MKSFSELLLESIIRNRKDLEKAINTFDSLPEGKKASEAKKIITISNKLDYDLKKSSILKYDVDEKNIDSKNKQKKLEDRFNKLNKDELIFAIDDIKQTLKNFRDSDSTYTKEKNDEFDIAVKVYNEKFKENKEDSSKKENIEKEDNTTKVSVKEFQNKNDKMQSLLDKMKPDQKHAFWKWHQKKENEFISSNGKESLELRKKLDRKIENAKEYLKLNS